MSTAMEPERLLEVKDLKTYFFLREGTVRALDGVSFEIKKGEFFGIVGRNGSGKSTLLKMLAGIYQPSGGMLRTHGSLVPIIELGDIFLSF